jgi:serralysin
VIGAAAQDADDGIVYDNTNGALFFDIDGVGGATAVRFATLSAGLALTNLDFLVV